MDIDELGHFNCLIHAGGLVKVVDIEKLPE